MQKKKKSGQKHDCMYRKVKRELGFLKRFYNLTVRRGLIMPSGTCKPWLGLIWSLFIIVIFCCYYLTYHFNSVKNYHSKQT